MIDSRDDLTDDSRDPQLQALFAAVDTPPEADDFGERVMRQVGHAKRRMILRRVCVALAISLIAIPLQDYALALSQVLIVSLVDIESDLVAQLLAPINSVGGLLSVVVLLLRLVHKRLFT